MARYFTHYWKRENCNRADEGFQLDFVEGSQFTKRGVDKGDFIYAVTQREGKLFLIAKMQVDEITPSKKRVIDVLRLDYDPLQAKEYKIARWGTPIRFDREVPFEVTKRLRFISSKSQSLKFIPGTKQLDQQTLRTLRELTSTSAAELDKLLKNVNEIVHA